MGAQRGRVEGPDLDVRSPEAPGLVLVFRCDLVAESDAGVAIEATIRLLVECPLAVGVGRHHGNGEAVRPHGLGLETLCRAEGAERCRRARRRSSAHVLSRLRSGEAADQ